MLAATSSLPSHRYYVVRSTAQLHGPQTLLRPTNYHFRPSSGGLFHHGRPNTLHVSRNVTVRSSAVPGVPPPPAPSSSASWQMWLVGVVLSILLPSFRSKMWSLKSLKDRVDSVVETVEMITDIVEDVAEQVEKVADDIGNSLPAGRLKEVLEMIEDVADKAEKSAELAGDVIDKVQEVGEDVEEYIESAHINMPQLVQQKKIAQVLIVNAQPADDDSATLAPKNPN